MMVRRQPHLRSFWNKASGSYDEYVTDKLTAYPEIRNYENFEEALILEIIKRLAAKEKDFAFIEAGSGTGRYMEILGYKVTKDIERPEDDTYAYDDSSKHLRLIVGIDFADNMIKIAEEKLRRIVNEDGKSLYELLGDRLRLINRPIEDIPEEEILSGEEKRLSRFVCCVFGTLGNIHSEARKSTLKRLREWVGSDGILLISVFNSNRLKELGYYSYWAVRGLVGVPDIDYKDGNVITKEGFLSHWYTMKEIGDLSKEVDLKYKRIMVGERSGIEDEERGLDSRRGLMLIASTEEISWLDDVLKGIKRDKLPDGSILNLERGELR